MNDILISGAIILGCLFVFVLMAVLVVDSHKKSLAEKSNITITFTEHDYDNIIAAAAHMRQWSLLLDKQTAENTDPTLDDLRSQLNVLLDKQQVAIQNEDYELAAECRDQLDSLKAQLKKFEND